jgi:hypothetical protein
MGRLTDSLKSASADLDAIETGIEKMGELGQELAENTINVADAALKTGYQYAKSEVQEREGTVPSPPKALPEVSQLQEELKSTQQSQSSLQTWNDIYRIQQALVIEYLKQNHVDNAVIEDVETIFKLRSVRQAPSLADRLLDLKKSEIIRLLKKTVKYTAHLFED